MKDDTYAELFYQIKILGRRVTVTQTDNTPRAYQLTVSRTFHAKWLAEKKFELMKNSPREAAKAILTWKLKYAGKKRGRRPSRSA